MALLDREFIDIPLRLLLMLQECLEEVRIRGRQRLRPHCQRFHKLLERFGFLECVLDGFVVYRFGFRSFLAFLFILSLCLLLPLARLRGCFHGHTGGIAIRP